MADGDETSPAETSSAETAAGECGPVEPGPVEPRPADGVASAATPVMTWPTPPEPEGLEVNMLRAAAIGEPLIASEDRSGPASSVIRGAILYRLLVESQWPVHPKGVQLQGVHIAGGLDLEGAAVRCALRLQNCSFDQTAEINLTNATVSQLTLTQCQLPGLSGDTLRVTQNLVLNGSTFTGPLLLQGADIVGNLDCMSTKLGGAYQSDGIVHSLYADGLKVGGRVRLNLSFTAENTVWLRGAHVGGNLNCRDARLKGSGTALCCDGAKVEGNMYLDRTVTFRGMVDLRGADIGGALDCSAAVLQGGNSAGCSMFAEWLKVGGPVRLNSWTDGTGKTHPFGAAGTVWLLGADITANLNCRNAVLAGVTNAMVAERAKVGGNVIAAKVNVPSGKVSLVGAQIDGSLLLGETRLSGAHAVLQADGVSVGGDVLLGSTLIPHGSVAFPGAEITGKLEWTSAGQVQGVVDLRYAKVGQLEDDWTHPTGCWPTDGQLKLVGFSYGSISSSNATVEQRLAWIRSQWPAPKSGRASATARAQLPPTGTAPIQDALAQAAPGEASPAQATSTDPAPITPPAGDATSTTAAAPVVAPTAAPAASTPSGSGAPPPAPPAAPTPVKPAVSTPAPLAASIPVPPATAGGAASGFAAQPYEQLASVYQQAGQDKEARAVALARRRDLRCYGNLTPYRRALDWLLDRSIQYGYQTWRAIVALALVYVIAVAVYWAAEHHGSLIIPVMATKTGVPAASATHCTKYYPCFYPAGYAIDTVIPIINVHQADYWGPNGHAHFGYALVVFTWITTLLGWALATLAVAGFTGIARSSDTS